jgi:hypothetical protein
MADFDDLEDLEILDYLDRSVALCVRAVPACRLNSARKNATSLADGIADLLHRTVAVLEQALRRGDAQLLQIGKRGTGGIVPLLLTQIELLPSRAAAS